MCAALLAACGSSTKPEGEAAAADTLQSLNRLIAQNPGTPVLYFNRAQVHFERGDTAAALRDADQALKLDSANADFRFLRGFLAYRLGDDSLALLHLQRAVQLGTGNAEVYRQLGNVLNVKGRRKEALAAYAQAAALDSTQAAALFNQAFTYKQENNPALAEATARKALQRDSLHIETLSLLFDLLAVQPGRLEEAQGYTRRILRSDSLHPIGLYNEGLYYQKKFSQNPNLDDRKAIGYLKAAEAAYNRLLLVNPTYADAYYSRGYTYFLWRKLGQALYDFKEASRLKPTDHRPHFMMGSIYEASRNYPKAADSYRKALTLKPDFADARRALTEVEGKTNQP
jgi:tetratricopeptide (TPR) repeat protein